MSIPRPPAAGETHVWIVDTALLEPHGRPLRALAADDSPRALGRGFLRVLLGGYLGVPAPDVPLERRCPACGGPHGPPLADDLRISVSYTAGRVAYAVATVPVGVDIERLRSDLPWRRIAPLVFSSREVAWLESQPRIDQATAFLRAWTRREAIGKATGVGLVDPPPPAAWCQRVGQIPAGTPYVASVAHPAGRLAIYQAIDELPSLATSSDPSIDRCLHVRTVRKLRSCSRPIARPANPAWPARHLWSSGPSPFWTRSRTADPRG